MNRSFFYNPELKSLVATPQPSTALQWQYDQEHFLSAVRLGIATGNTEGLAAEWQHLCQHHGEQRPLSEWILLFRTLHAICQPLFAHIQASDISTSSSEETWQQQFSQIISKTLPMVMPMRWHIVACKDVVDADAQTPTPDLKSADKSLVTLPAYQHCTLLYWQISEELYCRYCQPPKKPVDVKMNDLSTTKTTGHPPNPLVENILGLLNLQDLLRSHALLTTEKMRILLTHLQQKKYLELSSAKEEDAKAQRIIRQQSGDSTIYFGQWFTAPTIADNQPLPLPGRWQIVYPEPIAEPLEISDSNGWIRLEPSTHSHVLELLYRRETQEKRKQHREIAQQLCMLYVNWEDSVIRYLPYTVQIHWHLTTAETAAQQQRWLWPLSLKFTNSPAPPTAITQGCAAATLVEQKESGPTTAENIYKPIDGWMQAQMRHSLHPLLPQYQQQLHLVLEPLQRPAGKISLENFQHAIKSFKELLLFLTWLDSEATKSAYALFNQACMQRQNDIFTQIQALATSAKPTDAQTKEYQEWQTALATLLHQWERDGYQTVLEMWQAALHQQIPTLFLSITSSLQDEMLSMLAQGLATLAPEIDSLAFTESETKQERPLSIPTAWEQGQKTALNGLCRYAAQQQLSAFQHLKRRYRVRLLSYQTLCEQLSHKHTDYAALADWCKTQVTNLDAFTPQLCGNNQQPPIIWPWQSLRQSKSTFTPIIWLQQICGHLEKLLPPAPCCFEVLGMQSSTQPTSWRIHILVADQSHCQQPYFVAWQELLHLYQTLLPTSCLPLTATCKTLPSISVTAPKTLAHRYCPLWHEDQDTAEMSSNYLPIFYYKYSNVSVMDQQPQRTLFTAFVAHISRRLPHAAAQGREEEKAIRIRHHALATHTLVVTDEEAKKIGDRDLLDTNKMLSKRLHAQREIQRLWQKKQNQYAPLVDILVYVTIKHPQLIEVLLQTVKERDSVTLSESKEHKTKTPEISDLKTTIPELQVYRRLPRILKPRFIQQLTIYLQTSPVPTEFKTVKQQSITQPPDQNQTSSISNNIINYVEIPMLRVGVIDSSRLKCVGRKLYTHYWRLRLHQLQSRRC